MTDAPNLHLLHTNADELRASLEQIKRILPMHIELAVAVAEARFAVYKAHLDAGFDQDQALELCRSFQI